MIVGLANEMACTAHNSSIFPRISSSFASLLIDGGRKREGGGPLIAIRLPLCLSVSLICEASLAALDCDRPFQDKKFAATPF